MKTVKYISLAWLQLLSLKSDTLLFFIHRFENTVFVLSTRADPQYYQSSFFFGPCGWKIYFSFDTSQEKSSLIWQPGPTSWKNHLSSASPRAGRVGYGPRTRPGLVQTSNTHRYTWPFQLHTQIFNFIFYYLFSCFVHTYSINIILFIVRTIEI